MFHQQFHAGVVGRFRPIQLHQARAFLSRVFDTPEYAKQHIRLMITSTILDVAYGRKISGMDDEYVHNAEKANEALGIGLVPGASWLEYLPYLKYIPSWVPGNQSMKLVDHYKPYISFTRDRAFAEVKAALDSGTAPASVCATLLEEHRVKYGGTEAQVEFDTVAKNIMGVAYQFTLETFIVAMAMYPDVQRKAQAELDRVIGPNRLPEYDDVEALHYLRAVLMETTRWLPIIPLGIPHMVTEDDVYKGWRIPKGSLIIPNAWAMLHNPKDYPDPQTFRPERFLTADGIINADVRDPTAIAFGFGRRICPGKPFVENTLMIFMASVLHSFDITPGVDTSGRPIELSGELNGSFLTAPRDVPRGFTPRSQKSVELIRNQVL
ncbi:hypothetical protein EIP91_004101 [Steccherinum ochraceum]|uniref:O-methylsterigmatocystin oxidoreductase n=1 Tax=Steccherinum ochraceum TaxID=92696 RepID=A0A4R0R9D6_9APHY|nr:hypothetical protein EIP91_004101 [Steccherinum ochraceum]